MSFTLCITISRNIFYQITYITETYYSHSSFINQGEHSVIVLCLHRKFNNIGRFYSHNHCHYKYLLNNLNSMVFFSYIAHQTTPDNSTVRPYFIKNNYGGNVFYLYEET